jgi:hypothetical protein
MGSHAEGQGRERQESVIRKSISLVLAGLLTVVPALVFIFRLLGYWTFHPEAIVSVLVFCFTVGVIWFGIELSEILWGGR